MNKRGLSSTLGTVLVILIAIAAVGIMWALIRPIFSEVTGGIDGSLLSVKLSIVEESVFWDKDNEIVKLKVARDPGQAELAGIIILVQDFEGRTMSQRWEGNLEEFEVTEEVTIDYGGNLDEQIIAVEVYPVLLNLDGNELNGNLADRYEFRGDEEGGEQEGEFEKFRIFVTAADYGGNLGGLSGADSICQGLAGDLGGNWKAWLSNSSNSVSERFESSREPYNDVPYELIDGSVVANNWADLTDGIINNKINIDKDGNPTSSPFRVFTNTDEFGEKIETRSRDVCGDWTNGESRTGRAGSSASSGHQWTDFDDPADCPATNNKKRIYCFEQP